MANLLFFLFIVERSPLEGDCKGIGDRAISPRIKIGANKTKSTKGTQTQFRHDLQSVSTDFVLLDRDLQSRAGEQRHERQPGRSQSHIPGSTVERWRSQAGTSDGSISLAGLTLLIPGWQTIVLVHPDRFGHDRARLLLFAAGLEND